MELESREKSNKQIQSFFIASSWCSAGGFLGIKGREKPG
jgi:hypothetical protein